MKPKAKRVREFLSAVQQMTLLAWQAQKFIFVSLLSLEIVQGFMPLASAWIIKQIFDVLTTNQGDTLAFTQKALPWLAVQGGIAVAVQMITHVNAYFEAELGRQLQLKTQTIIYERVADLSGLAYFENPEFHNTLELASQGIYSGPAQILKTFTYTIRSSITLLSFMGALFFLSPLLAVIIACASLPQLIAQLKIGRQRFSVAYLNSPKARLIGYLGQVLSSFPFAKEMRLFNLKRYFLERFTETTRDVQRTQRAQQLREISWQLGLGVTSSAATSLAFIIVVSQAFSGRITIGDVTLYFSALSSVQGAVSSIIFAFASLDLPPKN